MSFDALFQPLEELDAWLAGLIDGAGVRDRPAARPGRHRRGRRPAHRGDAEPLYRTVLVPALGVLGLAFGLWYAGFT
jgi:hypothetical protein